MPEPPPGSVTVSMGRKVNFSATVNAIAPGFIAKAELTGHWSKERIEGIIAETSAGRTGNAGDAAAAVYFPASPGPCLINGEAFNGDSGRLFGH